MKRILETEVMDNLEESLELDKMSQLYIYILNEAMARAALKMGIAKGLVLEIGVGPARIAVKLAKYNSQFSIIGIDLSRHMLKIAKKNIQDSNTNGNQITLIKADAKKLPFKKDSFDLVISQNMLHHLPDPLPLLMEIRRVLKSEGAILIRDVIRPSSKLTAKLYANIFSLNYTKSMKGMYYNSMLAGLSIKDIKQFLEKCGFSDTIVTRYFLTHFGIEKRSPLHQKITFTPQKLDFLREWMLDFYK